MISNCQNGTPLEFALASGIPLSRCKHSGIFMNTIQDQIGISAKSELGTDTELEAWELIEGKQITSVNGKLGVMISQPLSYTQFKIADHPAMTSSLENFGGSNLAYIAMIDSPTKPNATGEGTKIFGPETGIDLSCVVCDENNLSIIAETSSGIKTFLPRVYTEQPECQWSIDASTKITSNWYQAPVLFMVDNIAAPLKTHTFEEFYFSSQQVPQLKLQDVLC
jgi:hypothetical protein